MKHILEIKRIWNTIALYIIQLVEAMKIINNLRKL